jgi:pyrroloquinoline-quinone synthase
MNSFVDQIKAVVEKNHVLKHPFYAAWNEGKLTNECLRTYAQQYFHHVKAFPRYISTMHARCESLPTRQMLLENLIDEERGSENHPELWMRFAEALGSTRQEVEQACAIPEIQDLVSTFFRLAQSSTEEGLGALYAYESQVPEVAETKIKGLQAFYGIKEGQGLQFFEVHQKADCYHREAVEQILGALSPEAKERALKAAEEASQKVWNFLTGICRETGVDLKAA